MTRRSLLTLFAATQTKPQSKKPPPDPCPVDIVVNTGPSIVVAVPRLAKDDLVEIAATFFGREKPDATKKIGDQFRKATDVTLILTTKCERYPPSK